MNFDTSEIRAEHELNAEKYEPKFDLDGQTWHDMKKLCDVIDRMQADYRASDACACLVVRELAARGIFAVMRRSPKPAEGWEVEGRLRGCGSAHYIRDIDPEITELGVAGFASEIVRRIDGDLRRVLESVR
jgi:hypothetical protein